MVWGSKVAALVVEGEAEDAEDGAKTDDADGVVSEGDVLVTDATPSEMDEDNDEGIGDGAIDTDAVAEDIAQVEISVALERTVADAVRMDVESKAPVDPRFVVKLVSILVLWPNIALSGAVPASDGRVAAVAGPTDCTC
jgi:hypothetical protein